MKKSRKSTIRNLVYKLQTQKVDFLETFKSGDRTFFHATAALFASHPGSCVKHIIKRFEVIFQFLAQKPYMAYYNSVLNLL